MAVGVLLCVATFYKGTVFFLSRTTKDYDSVLGSFVADLVRGDSGGEVTGTCSNPRVTADYVVDDFYDKVRFTKDKVNGLYILNETDSKYADPNLKKSLRESEPLTIVVVPHSHNDPGWLWTLNTYYEVRTKQILSNTVKFLTETPDFRMIWSETIFLQMWWQDASQQDKQQLKKLLTNGQLEILSGGWVSVDEATTHYTAVLDQLIEGHLWIKDNLGVTVNTSWSIDPFGYSLTLPYLWKKSGMSNMAILRIHGAVKAYMGNRQLLTYKWRQPWDPKGRYDITCHVEPYTLYNIEYSCGPNMDLCKRMDFAREPDFPPLMSKNAPKGIQSQDFEHMAELIVEQYRLKATQYRHNVILMPHGDDFRYISDYEWQRQYVNMKRLIMFVNSKKEWNVKMKFGTVGEYFGILENEIEKAKDRGEDEPVITGDYFTYTDRDHEYWSGYFTTRPFDKRMIRTLLELLKVTEIVTSYAVVHAQQSGHAFVGLSETLGALQSARRAHGLVQHHDAITGTSAHPTVVDFEKRTYDAISRLQQVLGRSLQYVIFDKIIPGISVEPLFIQSSPEGMMSSKVIKVTKEGTSIVFINGYSQRRKEVQSIIVNTPDVEVVDGMGNPVVIQINPYIGDASSSDNQPDNGDIFIIPNAYELLMELSIPPMSCVTYTVRTATLSTNSVSSIVIYNGKLRQPGKGIFDILEAPGNSSGIFILETPYLAADFSARTGTLQRICNKGGKPHCAKLGLDWVIYQTGNSNAYTFGTDIKSVQSLLNTATPVVVIAGKLASQVRIRHAHYKHVVTLYHSEGLQGMSVHIDNIATLVARDNPDAELMMRINSDIVNENNHYFTDSNGYQLVGRQYRSELPVGANFYPITSMAVLEDNTRRLTLHAAQPHGVGSLRDGQLDVMIERIPMSKGKGLEEPVIDQKPAPSKFLLSLEQASVPRVMKRDNKDFVEFPSLTAHLMNDLLQSPTQTFLIANVPPALLPVVTMVKQTLPPDVVFSNVKTMMTDNLAFLGTGVTLHRRQTSCVFKGGGTSKKVINLLTIFNNVEIDQVDKMSLTHVHTKERTMTHNIHLDPGEMDSYYIRWK